MNKSDFLKSKILTQETLYSTLAIWKFRGEQVVFTNGCFDVIHRGHVEYLSQAASLGSKLVIGLNSDASVRRLKGPDRPINDEESRAVVMAGFGFVDAVVLFEEDTPLNLIKRVKPQLLVKGGDYKIEDIVGYKEVKESGGEVVTIDFVDGFSSTSIINKGGLV